MVLQALTIISHIFIHPLLLTYLTNLTRTLVFSESALETTNVLLINEHFLSYNTAQCVLSITEHEQEMPETHTLYSKNKYIRYGHFQKCSNTEIHNENYEYCKTTQYFTV
jgi:hypothetical protein